MHLDNKTIDAVVRAALKEDIGKADVTTNFMIPPNIKGKTHIYAKENTVLCGVTVAKRAFLLIDPRLSVTAHKKDGQFVKKNTLVLTVEGTLKHILAAERAALNFLSLLSGIATHTKRFMQKIKNQKVILLDTRKTTPNLRIFEKYAVRTAGAKNHRMGLWDAILIKDNHLWAAKIITRNKLDYNFLQKKFSRIRKKTKLPIEIEVESFKEFKAVIRLEPARIMLDNFNLLSLKKSVRFRDNFYPRVKLEASGGITLKNITQVAKTGVDYISVGALTHSPKSIDFSLEIADE